MANVAGRKSSGDRGDMRSRVWRFALVVLPAVRAVCAPSFISKLPH